MLTPSGIMNRAPRGVFYLLSEGPIYIFLSLFSVLVSYWAELIHFWGLSRSYAFLKKMRWPLLIVNFVLYAVFISILIAFSRVDTGEQKTLRLAYQLLVACVAGVLVIGVAVYGCQIWLLKRNNAIKLNQKKSQASKKLAIIILVSMGSLICQVVFLFINAVITIRSVDVAVAYSFVAELLPCAVLIAMFIPQVISKAHRIVAHSSDNERQASSSTAGPSNELHDLASR